ncbi:unnamed protein product [Caenorhabditis nigoni]
MIAQFQLLLSLIANFAILVFVVNCGGKKKGAAAPGAAAGAAGGAAGGAGGPASTNSNDSKKQTPSKMDKPADKKDGDDGNYEELAVPQ